MHAPRPLRTFVASGALAASLSAAACRTLDAPPGPCEVAAEVRAVAVGESHDDPAHHAEQVRLLECMRRGGGKLLLGMEMFQRPFQQALDDYVAGTIDEREMLRRTEYFTRWNFDYTLYAPLWRACRQHGIRIVALNPEASITRKIGRDGLASLAPEDRARVAAEVDLGVASHRKRILAVFQGGAHPMPPERLERLYEAQTVWDETMAESAARALADAGPGARILLVAGSQHVQQFDGIPARLERRIGPPRPYVVVLRTNGRDVEDDPIDVELGDAVVRLAPSDDPPAPKLGVTPGAERPEGLAIHAVAEGSAAARAGLLAGDVLTHLDGEDVRDLTDLRWVLDPKSPGEGIALRWLRAGVPGEGSAVLEAPAPPPQP